MSGAAATMGRRHHLSLFLSLSLPSPHVFFVPLFSPYVHHQDHHTFFPLSTSYTSSLTPLE